MRVALLLYVCIAEASTDFSWQHMGTQNPQESTTEPYHWNVDDESQTQGPSEACTLNSHSCGCCTMVRAVKDMEEQQNTTMNELMEEITSIHQSLDAINASRVAFSACLYNESTLQCEEPTASDNVIKYRHVFLNVGNAYSVVNGTFIAPVHGIYSLAVTVYSDSGSSAIDLEACASLFNNGERLSTVRDRNNFDHEDSATMVLAVTLNAGDEVTVRSASGCMLCDDGHYNTFSAFLLYSLGE